MKAIVLAAGKGTRLNSEKENIPKVLREINKKTLVEYCLDSISFIDKADTVIVVGFQREKIIELLGNNYTFCIQEKQLGTGHAVLATAGILEGKDDDVLIIYGDMPLTERDTLLKLIKKHKDSGADMTILTTVVNDPLPYGRIIRNGEGKITGIIEEKDTDEKTKEITELNVGVIVVKLRYLYTSLKKLKNNNSKGEFYLTNLTQIFVEDGYSVETFCTENNDEIRGINTPEDLEFAKTVLNNRYR